MIVVMLPFNIECMDFGVDKLIVDDFCIMQNVMMLMMRAYAIFYDYEDVIIIFVVMSM